MSAAVTGIEPRAGRSWQAEVDRIRAEAGSRFLPFVEAMNPGVRERDRINRPISHALFERAAEIGLLQFSLPAAVGGEARDKFEWGIVIEELSVVSSDPAFSVLLDISIETLDLILRSGRTDLTDRYVSRLAAGRWIATAAAYESRDPHDFASTAREANGHWLLNGRKAFVAGARMADLFVAYVRDARTNDLLGFLVERDDPGVTISGLETMGARSLGLGQISLCEVRLPSERLLWSADALSQMNSYARNRRLMTAASLVGRMDAVARRCVERLATRVRGGRPVLDYPNVERAIGEMRVEIETSRAIVHRALDATRGCRDPYFDTLATAAKHRTADAAIRVGQLVMNLHGGEGYMTLQPWERYMRDMLGMIGGQGAQEFLLIQLGQRTVVELDGQQASEQSAERRIARLAASHWALSTVSVALESGLLGELSSPRVARQIATSKTPALLEAMLELLAATGVVERRDDGLVVTAAAMQERLGDGARRAEVESELRSHLRAAVTFLSQARHAALDGESLGALTENHRDARDPVAQLARSSSALAVLAAALETRLLDELAVVRSSSGVSERLDAPRWVVERMLEVLAEAGLVRDRGGTYEVHPGFEPMLVSRVRRAQLESDARVTLMRRAGPLVNDPELDRLHDGAAIGFCDALFERHIAELEGLDDLLRERCPRAVVVGPGSAALAIELCRWIPTLRLTGLEPQPSDVGCESESVRAAGLDDRAQICGLRDLTADRPFALACIATAFHRREVLAAELARLRRSLADGGWLIALMPELPRDAVRASASRLRTAVSGGDPLLDEQGHERLLHDAGFPLVRALPQLSVMAARKLPERPGAAQPGP